MKTTLKSLISCCLLGSLAPAFAASTVDLSVKGLITPSSCTPSLSAGGQIDYGKVAAKDLNQTSTTKLAENRLLLKIDCEGPTAMAFKLIDNQPDTSSNYWYLGLGLTPAQEKIGLVRITFENSTTDNQTAHISESEDGGKTWSRNNGQGFYIGDSLHAPSNPTDPTQPIPSTHFATDLKIYAEIARADGLTLTEEVAFRASGTVEVHYL